MTTGSGKSAFFRTGCSRMSSSCRYRSDGVAALDAGALQEGRGTEASPPAMVPERNLRRSRFMGKLLAHEPITVGRRLSHRRRLEVPTSGGRTRYVVTKTRARRM